MRGPKPELRAVLEAAWSPVCLAVGVSVAVLLLASSSSEMTNIAISALINLVLVIGLYTFVGNSGVLSFGHISFMALGGYFAGALAIPVLQKQTLYESMPGILSDHQLGPVASVFVAALATGVIAYVLAIPLMRLNGIAAGIATFAILAITQILLQNWTAVFGPSGSLTGVPIDLELGGALAFALVILALAALFQHSRVGLRLRASREDEIAARAAGISVTQERRIAFTLGAIFMAVGGGMYAHFIGGLSPAAFYLSLTFLIVAMLVVGGTHSLAGAVVGWALLSVVSQILTRLEAGDGVWFVDVKTPLGLQQAILAVFMLIVLVFRPEGWTRGREIPLPKRRRRTRPRTGSGVGREEVASGG